jgi:hypothetical protein
LAGGSPNLRGSAVNDGLTAEEIGQRALDFSRAAVPYLPVVGPAYELGEDLRQGNYKGALMNGVMLAADLTPFGPARRVIKVVDAINDMKRGAPLLARDATQRARIRTIEKAGPDQEVHHTIPMGGWGKLIKKADRKAEGLARNHPANLKVMNKVDHHRLTRDWKDPKTKTVLKRFNAAQRAWHGTNALQKTTALAAGATAADWAENASRTSGGPAVQKPRGAERSRAERPRNTLDPTRPIQVRRTEQGFIISNKR